MSIRGWAPGREVSNPRGSWASLANRRKGTPSRATSAQNCRIQYGAARSRPGTSAVFAATGKVSGIFNWVTPSGVNLVLYQDADSVKSYQQSSATSATLLSGISTTRAPSFAPLDVWTYFCGYDTAGNGTFQTEIFDGTNVDKAFRAAPAITSWTAVDGGAGQCTAGQHFIGFVYQNRTGYAGVPVTGISYAITVATNASPTVLTAPGNNLQNGQTVQIAGGLGNTAINGTRIVTNVAGATFHLTDTDGNVINGNGVYAGSGIVTNPVQVTLAAGLRQINITVGLPSLADGGLSANGGVQATLFLIATRADNPNLWYFIPTDAQTGQIGEQSVPLSTPTTLNFVFSLSDEDIASSLAGDTAQANFLFLKQDANGAGPFNPNFVVAYGQRMCYGAGTTLYASDINNPQQIAADTNAVRMQNQRAIGYAFQLPGNTSLYLTGDRWTGYVTDNSDSPSTWGEPVQVSDALGAAFPNLVCAQTGGNYAWVVTEAGPYLFDGAYGEMPMTYLVSGYDENKLPIGWTRVNWAASYAIQIKDDVQNLKLYVAAPLDGATEPNVQFCIDYRMGKTFDTCDITLDVFNPQSFSSIGVVKEYATGKTNLWIGPSAAGNVRHFDVTTANDEGSAIDSFWQSGLVRGTEFASSMIRVGYLDLWIKGNAPLDAAGNSTLGLAIIGLDNATFATPELQDNMGIPAALIEAPGVEYSAKFDLPRIYNFTVTVRTFAVDSWYELSGFTSYSRPDLYNR